MLDAAVLRLAKPTKGGALTHRRAGLSALPPTSSVLMMAPVQRLVRFLHDFNGEASMKRLVLLTIHGMGSTDENFSADLVTGLARRLGVLWSNVSVQPVWYSPIFQDREDRLWAAMAGEPRNDLDSTVLRKLFLFGFADAAAFERSAHNEPDTYMEVQRRIRQALENGYAACGEVASTPVVVVAQSLGGQVFSSYAWDAQHHKHIHARQISGDPGLEGFVRLSSLRHLITTGCNIPIFTAGLRRRVNFQRPNQQCAWDNFYDPDDVLGWPLRQLDPEDDTYQWVRDHPISSGNFLTGWNPASHLGYWNDKDVLSPVAQSIEALLQEPRPAPDAQPS